jgi:hypothetical protein
MNKKYYVMLFHPILKEDKEIVLHLKRSMYKGEYWNYTYNKACSLYECEYLRSSLLRADLKSEIQPGRFAVRSDIRPTDLKPHKIC